MGVGSWAPAQSSVCFLKRFHTFWGCCRATSSGAEEQDLGSPDLAVQAPASPPISRPSAFPPWLIQGGGEAQLYLLFSCGSPAKPCPGSSLPLLPLVRNISPESVVQSWLVHFDWIPPPPSSLLQHLHFPMWQVVPYSRVFSYSCPST